MKTIQFISSGMMLMTITNGARCSYGIKHSSIPDSTSNQNRFYKSKPQLQAFSFLKKFIQNDQTEKQLIDC